MSTYRLVLEPNYLARFGFIPILRIYDGELELQWSSHDQLLPYPGVFIGTYGDNVFQLKAQAQELIEVLQEFVDGKPRGYDIPIGAEWR